MMPAAQKTFPDLENHPNDDVGDDIEVIGDNNDIDENDQSGERIFISEIELNQEISVLDNAKLLPSRLSPEIDQEIRDPTFENSSTSDQSATKSRFDLGVRLAEPKKIYRSHYGSAYYENPDSFTTWKGVPNTYEFGKYKLSLQKDTIINPKDVAEKLRPQRPKFSLDSNFSMTWLGHATVFVHMENVNFITDPVWALHASPVIFWQDRIVDPPCEIVDLPQIDFGLISHNHYDHLDKEAVSEISKKWPEMTWFVPEGLASWMKSTIGTAGAKVVELSWDQNQLLEGKENVQIWCLPAQHWSQRNLYDRCKSLWSGWAVFTANHSFLYTGDTGFCREEYEKIGKKFGGFDLAAIPIGCYEPRHFMSSQHIEPSEAVQIHKFIKAKRSVGIHWGTYDMDSSENFLQPPKDLQEACQKEDLTKNEFFTLAHGQTIDFPFDIEDKIDGA